ncbi:hypothetical protein B0O80DRAFT_446187 [Mortierella sp. GBAus27b]|nr:hypothetical protein BGX31_007656 [Mortierella sp. GBA43]KAI8356950.1 hypothetical protein B0O80DRAFT_446187 [Mortierella sp. GBAus27b]
MATPQSPKDRPKSVSSNSTPTSPVPLNTDNAAFFSEPSFDKTKSEPSKENSAFFSEPNFDKLMVNLSEENSAFFGEPKAKEPEVKATPTETKAAPSAAIPAAKQDSVTSAPVAELPVPPPKPTSTPTSPVTSVSQPTVFMNVDTTITEEVDSDVEMIEDKDGPVEDPKSIEAPPKENGVEPAGLDQNKAQSNRVEELQILNSSLQANLEEILMERQSQESELNRTRAAYHDLHRQYIEVQQKLDKRERDYEVMSKNYLEHVRQIRATDDDHGTIKDRLTQLKASIEHLIRKAQGGRSVNLNREAAVEHFKKSGLLEGFPVPEDKLESYHLNLYMESVVMTTLVTNFFDRPLSCVFEYNQGFKDIYLWMLSRNDRSAVRWRQQLCKMIADDPATKARQEQEVTRTAEELSGVISKVYANANELNKIKDICTRSFELALAMTGIESLISPTATVLGTPFDEETMGTSLKSNQEGKVALVIFPAFKDKECAFDVRPKVWCH